MFELKLCRKCNSVVGGVDENGLCDYHDGCSVKFCHRCLRYKESCRCPTYEELLEENKQLKERLEAADKSES